MKEVLRTPLKQARSVGSSESFLKPAMIRLMAHRLRPSHTEPEFHYRGAA
jgi:hypothetical protein